MKPYVLIILLILSIVAVRCTAQNTSLDAERIRIAYKIPELSYAVVSADSVYEIQALGVRKVNSNMKATLNDRFRIGSNTKAITGFIAAKLVQTGKIRWDTKFFDLLPQMKLRSDTSYFHLTLLNLLTFRARLLKYTYTDPIPTKAQFAGDDSVQRNQFVHWCFMQPPVDEAPICFSNIGFVASALMLEKVSGKSYQQLVEELGKSLGIHFDFGQPNYTDSLQTWGHNGELEPEQPGNSYKLNWLQAAGNINITLPDYIKFIQLQLKGLEGRSTLLSKETFEMLHYGLPNFAVGWFWSIDGAGHPFSYNIGNPGSFLTKVYVYKTSGKAVIIFTNAQNEAADAGTDELLEKLRQVYKLE